MKKLVFALLIGFITSTFVSCASTSTIQKNDSDAVTYTLKSKTELLEQKILNTRSKKVIVVP